MAMVVQWFSVAMNLSISSLSEVASRRGGVFNTQGTI